MTAEYESAEEHLMSPTVETGDFAGKVAFVTGSASGIGQAITATADLSVGGVGAQSGSQPRRPDQDSNLGPTP